MITFEGRASMIFQERCIQCDSDGADYRCSDCFGQELFCSPCLVSNHKSHPFHIIDVSLCLFKLARLNNDALSTRNGTATFSSRSL